MSDCSSPIKVGDHAYRLKGINPNVNSRLNRNSVHTQDFDLYVKSQTDENGRGTIHRKKESNNAILNVVGVEIFDINA